MSDDRFEAALRAWGSSARVGERRGGGNRNDVRAVRLNGISAVGRLNGRASAALAWEIELLDFLRDRGMRAPRVLAATDGRRQVDGLVVFEWIDGDPPRSERDWRMVADALGTLHRLTAGYRQRPGFLSACDLLMEDRGGDVHLDAMPGEAVQRCRAAWSALCDEPRSVIHGDPGPSNIRISPSGVGLIDWDEARVDASILDLASLPLEPGLAIDGRRRHAALRALDAWEAANGWLIEPDYARRRLEGLSQLHWGPIG
jgi:Ser/Thr protein kinase RdoA (MazF antagonist)